MIPRKIKSSLLGYLLLDIRRRMIHRAEGGEKRRRGRRKVATLENGRSYSQTHRINRKDVYSTDAQ